MFLSVCFRVKLRHFKMFFFSYLIRKLTTKGIVSTLSFELERRLKLKVEGVGVLIRHSYWGNSVSLLKAATPSKLQGRLNLVRINCCFKNTRQLIQTKEKSLDDKHFYSKIVREDLLRTLNTSLTR